MLAMSMSENECQPRKLAVSYTFTRGRLGHVGGNVTTNHNLTTMHGDVTTNHNSTNTHDDTTIHWYKNVISGISAPHVFVSVPSLCEFHLFLGFTHHNFVKFVILYSHGAPTLYHFTYF